MIEIVGTRSASCLPSYDTTEHSVRSPDEHDLLRRRAAEDAALVVDACLIERPNADRELQRFELPLDRLQRFPLVA